MDDRPPTGPGLVPGAGHDAAADLLAATCGGRVGLEGVLADLDRVAEPAFAPGRLTSWGFGWDREDDRSARWWPQGVTTSADACPGERYAGRDVVVTTAYSKNLRGVHQGCRITVVDVTDRERVRYAHVLLVSAGIGQDGELELRPLRAHAGGVVWHGSWLHVAATAAGLHTFRIADVVRAGSGRRDLLAPVDESVAAYGHRFVLPVHRTLRATTPPGAEPFRYSFLSRVHGAETQPPGMLAGEYGHGAMTTRLARFPLDGLEVAGPRDGEVVHGHLLDPGVPRMQGAVEVDGRTYLTSSRGRYRRGSLLVGRGGRFQEVRHALPVGPEDLAWHPGRRELWSVSEYPRQRLVFTVDLGRVDRHG